MSSLYEKVETYAKKFKEFDPEILEGVELCYRYSPTFRAHVDSPRFGEVLGWRITWLWTPHPKKYPMLKLIGPLDLGLFSVRIDGILGETDIDSFVEEARGRPIFRKYISATADFISALIENGECEWMKADREEAFTTLPRAVTLCREYSPTFRKLLAEGEGDGWQIVKLWTEDPEEITALRSIYPLDVGIYCVRLDSITYGINLTDFAKECEQIPAFKLFAVEITRFVLQVLARSYV